MALRNPELHARNDDDDDRNDVKPRVFLSRLLMALKKSRLCSV